MKKSTVNILLLAGAAAAAWFIFTSMRKKPKSSVEAGSPEKITEAEYEAATVEPAQPQLIKQAQSVVDVIKSLKRTPEAKAAAQKRKALKKSPKAKAAVKSFLTMPKAVRGVGNVDRLSVLC